MKLCKKGKLHDAAKLVREEIFDLLYKNAKKDKLVVRLHDGDPSIYGAIKEQIDNSEKKRIKSILFLEKMAQQNNFWPFFQLRKNFDPI